MSDIDPVTDIRGHCPHVPWEVGEAGTEEHAIRVAQASLDAWLAAARARGLEVAVLETFAPAQKRTYGVVEVNGKRYNVDQHGRGGDVEARPLP